MTGWSPFPGDERAISVTVSHALSIAITTVLVSGLLLGAGPFVESNERRVADSQLSEIGHSVASQVTTLDRLNATGENVQTTVDLRYPRSIAGSYSYTVELTADGVVVESPRLDRSAAVTLDTDTTLAASQANAPDLRVTLCETTTGDVVISLGGCD